MLNKLDKALLAVFSFIIIFDIVMICIYYHFEWNMDTIVTSNLTAGGVEAVVTGLITVFKNKYNQ